MFLTNDPLPPPFLINLLVDRDLLAEYRALRRSWRHYLDKTIPMKRIHFLYRSRPPMIPSFILLSGKHHNRTLKTSHQHHHETHVLRLVVLLTEDEDLHLK